MKTLVSTFLFPILLEFFNQQPYLHGLLNDQLLICILGGFLLGLGIGLVLKAGGSTGGFDILALIVEKYFKIPVTLLVNGIDAAILVLQISFHSAPEIVYGIMTILITAYMMNYLLSVVGEVYLQRCRIASLEPVLWGLSAGRSRRLVHTPASSAKRFCRKYFSRVRKVFSLVSSNACTVS